MSELASAEDTRRINFLTVFSAGCPFRAALRQVGSGMSEFEKWMVSYPGFKEAHKMAAQWNAEYYIEIADDWIQNGVPKSRIESTIIIDPVTGATKKIPHTEVVERKGSEILLQNRLKATIREIYGKQEEKKNTGPDIAEILAGARRRLGESTENEK